MRQIAFFFPLLIGAAALAVQTSTWTQTSEADFNAGTLENVVATNLGDLKLSRAVKTLLDQDPRISSVNALAEGADGSVYAGTGPHGVLLRISGEKVETVATLEDDAAITALLVDKDGAILIGTSGEAGRILKVAKAGEKPKVLYEPKDTQYIWALVRTGDGHLYAATGPEGKLFEVKPDGSGRELLDTDENNLTCLATDGKELLYAGSDTHGLVYRINRRTGERFVLYNAAEQEVSALALDKAGNLYAATAEAKEEPGGPAGAAGAEEKSGRPEGGAVGVPIPAERPKEPAPPAPPDPNPGRPNPIPKNPQARTDRRGVIERRAVALRDANRETASGVVRHPARGAAVRGSGVAASQSDTFEEFSIQPTLRMRGAAAASLAVSRFALTRGDAVEIAKPQAALRWHSTGTPYGESEPAESSSRASVMFALANENAPAAPAPVDPNKKRRPKPTPPPGGGDPEPGPTPTPGPKPKPPVPGVGPETAPAVAPVPGHQPAVDTTAPVEPRPEGNAIYKIDPEGFVTEIFRQPVLILSMVESNGTLLVATGGSEGQVFQVRPAADEVLVLAKVDAKEIMSLLVAKDGKVYVGTANVGTVAAMSGGFANKGTFTSAVLDATQISRFGKIQLHGALPPGTALTVATRSGNVKEADEKSWSKWSDEAPAAEFLQVMSPSARFLQYRLTFASAEGKATAVVEDVTVAYQVPNLPPQIKAVKIANAASSAAAEAVAALESGGAPAQPHIESGRRQTIAWDASDSNNDALVYTLYFRRIGEEPWIVLKDKLTEATYEWDTRTAADGRYEVKVVASDAAANPPGQGKTASRVSDPVTVDNTPPTIGDLKWAQAGDAVKIDLKVVDRTSTVAAVDYAVDSGKDWQFVLPADQIYDSPEETVSFTIPHLAPGQHQITLRATDAKGNQSFESMFANVQGAAAAAK